MAFFLSKSNVLVFFSMKTSLFNLDYVSVLRINVKIEEKTTCKIYIAKLHQFKYLKILTDQNNNFSKITSLSFKTFAIFFYIDNQNYRCNRDMLTIIR